VVYIFVRFTEGAVYIGLTDTKVGSVQARRKLRNAIPYAHIYFLPRDSLLSMQSVIIIATEFCRLVYLYVIFTCRR